MNSHAWCHLSIDHWVQTHQSPQCHQETSEETIEDVAKGVSGVSWEIEVSTNEEQNNANAAERNAAAIQKKHINKISSEML